MAVSAFVAAIARVHADGPAPASNLPRSRPVSLPRVAPAAPRPICASHRDRGGVVLVVVLVVIALLTLAAFTFSDLMQSERKAAQLSVRQAQARAQADSAIEMVRLFLAQPKATQDEAGGWYDNSQRFRARLVSDDGTGLDPGRFTLVAPAQENGMPSGIRFGLEDESAKLNLNALLVAEKNAAGSGREILMGLPGMTEQIADAILDWIDEDEEAREFGAEAEYYTALVPGYRPKNGPLETLDELLLVRDVTPALLYGADTNRNGIIDSNETSGASAEGVDNSDGSMDCGWAAYLTLYSLESNLDPDGQQKIDLNQSDMQTLYDALQPVLGQQAATFIVAYRQNGPYKSANTSNNASGQSKNESDEVKNAQPTGELDLTKPGKTKLTTILDLIGQKVQVTFVGQQEASVLDSPFANVPGLMDSYLPTLMDKMTVNTSAVIPGRININQASEVVLAGIPGMDQEIVDQIISQRQMDPAQAEDGQRHETWILNAGIVTLEQMKALMPFVTGGGSVYRAQAVGYFDRGGPAVRVEFIVDATSQPAKLVFFRDLSHLGRGFALETLGMEASQ